MLEKEAARQQATYLQKAIEGAKCMRHNNSVCRWVAGLNLCLEP